MGGEGRFEQAATVDRVQPGGSWGKHSTTHLQILSTGVPDQW